MAFLWPGASIFFVNTKKVLKNNVPISMQAGADRDWTSSNYFELLVKYV